MAGNVHVSAQLTVLWWESQMTYERPGHRDYKKEMPVVHLTPKLHGPTPGEVRDLPSQVVESGGSGVDWSLQVLRT